MHGLAVTCGCFTVTFTTVTDFEIRLNMKRVVECGVHVDSQFRKTSPKLYVSRGPLQGHLDFLKQNQAS